MSHSPPPTPSVSRHALDLVGDYLDATAAATHQRLGDVAGVAVTSGVDGEPRTIGASTPLAAEVDRMQLALGDGPCLDALRGGRGGYVPDLARDARWGGYGPAAAERGAACCVSVPVRVEGRTQAVFKVYAAVVDGLDADQQRLATTIALEITGGIALASHVVRLSEELDDLTAMAVHRRVIDLALGISMQRAEVDAATAFDLLRVRSQQQNAKLHDVAAEVVASVPGTTRADLVPPYNPRG